MKTYKLKVLHNIKQWYSWPVDVEIEATDPATAITLAWDQAHRRGITVTNIIVLT